MKHLSLVLLLALPTFLISQEVKTAKDFEVEIGPAYPVVDAKIKEYFHHNNEILSIKVGGVITVQKFNANALEQTTRKEIPIKKNLPRGFVHEEFVQNRGKVFQFYNVWDKPNETEQIFVHEITFASMQVENNRLVSKIKGKVQSTMGKDKIDIYQSFDYSKYLMVYRRHPKVKSDKVNKDVIGMTVLDENMKPIWEKEITMPYTEKNMDNLGYTIDSKGNAYLLARVRTENKEKHLELLKYNNSGTPKITRIEAQGKKFPHGITLEEGKNGAIYCAGFYGEGRSSNGVYVSIIDNNGVITNEQFHDIPLEIINQNVRKGKQDRNAKKEGTKKEVGIHELDLDHIVVNDDGSFLIVGEVYYVTKTSTTQARGAVNNHTGMNRRKTTYVYNYQDMFMAKLTADGKVAWMKKMAKRQKYTKSTYGGGFGFHGITTSFKRNGPDLSYIHMTTGDNHYLLYLDNIKNLDLPLDKYPAVHSSGKGGFLTAYKINDASGDVSKLSLFDLRDVKGIPVYQFNTGRIIQPSDKEILLEVYKKKKQDILLRINLN
ncbi:MAG: hypothetical protein COB15_07290 [Flavobacteriales bacterium]|nr:MAG: hypothetical protein COB15_07290 [Flavobacteriales bacterium]